MDSATLQATLTVISVEYVKECLSKIEKAESELIRLNKAGLSACANAKVLSKMSPEAHKLARQIKQAYPQALIVPYVDLFRVMKEYNLSVGLIKHYNKFIPEENINQICEAAEAFKNLGLNRMRYIYKISIDSDMPKSEVKKIAAYVARFPLWDESLNELIDKHYNSIKIYNRVLEQDEWLIAAPVADLPENTTIEYFSGREENRKRIAEDPIVFKASSIGAVIVSMWGEEADSSIFDKYR